MSEQEVRIARTEALFRDVNERIAETAGRFAAASAEFVCECADQACTERVEATLEEYEHVRADGTHFILRPGHEDTRVERVVERRAQMAIVEKFNRTVAKRVKQLNPRAEPAPS